MLLACGLGRLPAVLEAAAFPAAEPLDGGASDGGIPDGTGVQASGDAH